MSRGDRTLRWVERILRLAPSRFRERRGHECLRVHAERLRSAPGGWRGFRFRARELAGAVELVVRLRLGREVGDQGALQSRVPGGVRPFGWSEALAGHLRISLRALRRHPGYAWTTMAVLALGIGGATGVFSAANAYLFRPLPFADADRLHTVYETNPDIGWTRADAVTAAPANVLDWRERVAAFEDVAMYSDFVDRLVYPGDGEPRLLTYAQVSGNFFDVLGVRPALGPGFDREDTWAREESGFGIVLSHGLWQRMFGGDPEVVGRTLDFGVQRAEVVGVMPASFRFPSDDVELWLTYGWARSAREAVWFRRAHFVRPVVRLAPGATPERAARELEAVVARLQEEYPGTNEVMGAHMVPFRDFLTRDVRGPLGMLLGASGLLLLLAAVNVTTLALVRAGDREREVTVRRALGAGRRRVASLVVAEAVVLSLFGGAMGLAAAWVGGRALAGVARIGIDGATAPAMDHRVLFVGLGASLLCGLAAGGTAVGRALAGGRSGLRSGDARSSKGPERRRGARLLVATEVAVAVVLLVGAGLMIRTARSLHAVDPGFETAGVVAAEITVPVQRYEDGARTIALQDQLVRALDARPGVEAAGIVGGLPLTSPGWSSQFKAAGWTADRVGWNVVHRRADQGYFDALGIPLVRGRDLSAGADSTVPLEVVVNETFVREHFPGEDPIGVRIAYDEEPTESSYWYEIVGVVGDQHQVSPGTPPRAEIFEHRRQDWGRTVWVVARMGGRGDGRSHGASGLAPSPTARTDAAFATLRSVIEEIDPLLLPERMRSLDEVRLASMERERAILALLGGFGVVALLLAAVGVYGVTAQLVRRRRREIGIRMALGAARGRVRGMVLGQGMSGAAVGLASGLAAAVALTRIMESILYGVRSTDPATMASVAVVVGLVALVACWIPARRATRTDPVETLRTE